MPDDGVREQIDEIFEACRSFETGVANSYEFDESQAKHRIEALIAAAETKARIDELSILRKGEGWIYTLDELSDRGSYDSSNAQESGEGNTADRVIQHIDDRLAHLRAQKEREA